MNTINKILTDYEINSATWKHGKLTICLSPRPEPLYEIQISDKASITKVLELLSFPDGNERDFIIHGETNKLSISPDIEICMDSVIEKLEGE